MLLFLLILCLISLFFFIPASCYRRQSSFLKRFCDEGFTICCATVFVDLLPDINLPRGFSAHSCTDWRPSSGTEGEFFLGVAGPVLNDFGSVAFYGTVTGHPSYSEGLWSEGVGTELTLVARERDAAPDTDATFERFNDGIFSLHLSNSGHTGFMATLYHGFDGGGNRGFWRHHVDTGSELVARTVTQAPGTELGTKFSGASIFGVRIETLNDSGQTAFMSFLTAVSGGDRGVWSEGGNNGLELLGRNVGFVPGGTGEPRFSSLGDPVLNDIGHVALSALLLDPDTNFWLGHGIVSDRGGNGLEVVVPPTLPAPGTDAGVILYPGQSKPAFNNLDQLAFLASLDGPGVVDANDQGIWSEGSGSGLSLVAREGNQAPGTDVGVSFSSLGTPVINSIGQTAFQSELVGAGVDATNGRGIWSEKEGTGLTLVARNGDLALGAGDGVYFSGLGKFVLNGNGQTAFWSSLVGSGVDTINDKSIWAEDISGNLQLIAREGDLLDVDDGSGTDFRTIRDLIFSSPGPSTGNEDGHTSAFNEYGQLAFNAIFTDGTSGVFVSNLVATPEPSTLLLGLLAFTGLLISKRR